MSQRGGRRRRGRSGDGPVRGGAKSERPRLRWLRRERDALREEVARLQRELESIHGSRMWTLWMGYHRLRRALLWPLRVLRLLPSGGRRWAGRAVRGTASRLRRAGAWAARTGGRGLRALGRGLRGLLRPVGWVYLLGYAAAVTVRGRQREGKARVRTDLPGKAPGDGASETAREAREAGYAGAPGRRPRVLLVTPYAIHPPDHGGGVRLWNLVRRLAESCDLYLLVFSQKGENPAQRQALEPYAARVDFHHWRPALRPTLLGLSPPNAQIFASSRVEGRIRGLVRTYGIDVVQLEYTELGQYAAAAAPARVILTEHDIASRQHGRRRRLGFHRRFPEGRAYGSSFADWMRVLRYELAVCRLADEIHVMSRDDGEHLATHMPDGGRRIRVVPNAVDTAYYEAPEGAGERQGVLYVGNFQNLPNVDALEYFARDVWPLVRLEHPQATLSVVGAHPSPRVKRFDGQDGIRVVGPVPEVRPHYHGHRLMVAPIRAGSGTRLKILEAFAAGIPVVSTTLGAEGIEAVHGEHLLLADTAVAFAQAVARLLADGEECRRLAEAARALAVGRYDWQVSADASLGSYRALMATTGEGMGSSTPRTPMEPAGDGVPASAPSQLPEGEAGLISIVIPTYNGGERLGECLEAIFAQETSRRVEVLCVDSGSRPEDLERMRRFPVRIEPIDKADFDHGLTRDLGARLSRGEVLVFLNQDAVPCNRGWLARLTEPLYSGPSTLAAIQGGIREVPAADERFYWDSCGQRFYFTRESERWIDEFQGIGFSTVNAALRRVVWHRHPFGWAPIMEDKKWQREVVEAGYAIAARPGAAVFHTHNYRLRSLVRRCQSEGFGWRTLGERYSLLDMLRDMSRPRVYADLVRGLARGRVRNPAELLFPWLRPLMIYWGNRWVADVKH